MNSAKRWVAMVLSMILVLGLLSGCGSKEKPVAEVVETVTPASIPDITVAPSNDVNEAEPVATKPSDVVDALTDEQKNSLNMLNYLAYITQEILARKNNRVFIEEIYTSLLNDINPSTVNDITESHYADLLDRLHEFEKLLTKRERLQYLFEQNQAQAMRNAIPNPIGLLSAVKSMNIVSLVASVAYMAVDSVTSYASGMSSAEQTFLQGTWDLDDEESDTIHSLREQTFMYMVEVVKGYTLPDKLTLTEKKVDKLVEWNGKTAAEESAAARVHFYKTYEADYEGFGQYWLARASAHFDNKEYEECLNCIQRYEELKIGIYRQDYELSKVLPVAIGAASQVYDDKTYVETAGRYADLIVANTEIKANWALRYFAAQTYIDISARTNDPEYLRKAYKIALENANELKSEQKKLNNEYIEELKPEVIPQGTTDSKKKEIEAYNTQKKLERETELPPVYEPLKLNLDLLYALADEIGLSDKDKQEMEDILYVDGKSLFVSEPMNNKYRNTENKTFDISFTGRDLMIPVTQLTPEAEVIVTVNNSDGTSTVLDDWMTTKVERKGKGNVSSYIATYHSKKAESVNYMNSDNLEISILSLGTEDEQVYKFSVNINKSKDWLVFDKVEFEVGK